MTKPVFTSAWSFSRVWGHFYPMPDFPRMDDILKRGQQVHLWTQLQDEGGTVRPPSPYEPYCEAYKSFCYSMAPSWTHIEQPFENGQWHGIIDRIGYLKGHEKLVVADIKTGKGQGVEAQLRVATQLASYAMGWLPTTYKQCLRVGIYLHKDGTWRTKVYDDMEDFRRWTRLLKEVQNNGKESTETIGNGADQAHDGSAVCDDQQPPDVSGGIQDSGAGAAAAPPTG